VSMKNFPCHCIWLIMHPIEKCFFMWSLHVIMHSWCNHPSAIYPSGLDLWWTNHFNIHMNLCTEKSIMC
jgi:uncharacterized iron-regulated membrane protein